MGVKKILSKNLIFNILSKVVIGVEQILSKNLIFTILTVIGDRFPDTDQ